MSKALGDFNSRANTSAKHELGERQRAELASVVHKIETLKRRAAAASARAAASDISARASAAELSLAEESLLNKEKQLANALMQVRDAMHERDACMAELAAAKALASAREADFSTQGALLREEVTHMQALLHVREMEAEAHAAEAGRVRELLRARHLAGAEADVRHQLELRMLQVELCSSELDCEALLRVDRSGMSATQAAPPASLDPIVLQGWALKQSRWRRVWRVRWLLLVSEDGGRSCALLSLRQRPQAHAGDLGSLRAMATECLPVDGPAMAGTVQLSAGALSSTAPRCWSACAMPGWWSASGMGGRMLAVPFSCQPARSPAPLMPSPIAPRAPCRSRSARSQRAAAAGPGGACYQAAAPLLCTAARLRPAAGRDARQLAARTRQCGACPACAHACCSCGCTCGY